MYLRASSSVHGIFQARILEWVAISSFRGSPQSKDETASPMSPPLQANSLPTELSGKPKSRINGAHVHYNWTLVLL